MHKQLKPENKVQIEPDLLDADPHQGSHGLQQFQGNYAFS